MSCLSSQVPHDKDTKLMREAAHGDIEAFECLYRRFGPPLRQFAAVRGADPGLCDDLTQKIFARLWDRRKDFRAESSFETYLFSIARNTLSKEMRRTREIAAEGLQNHPERSGDSHHGLSQPEAEFYLEELAAAIEEATGRLTEGQRQALDTTNAVDTPLGKASGELGCSHGAFKKRLKRARKRLRELLAPHLDDENDSDKT